MTGVMTLAGSCYCMYMSNIVRTYLSMIRIHMVTRNENSTVGSVENAERQ